MTRKNLTWALATLATLLAIGTATSQVWDSIGWTTPSHHHEDMDSVDDFRDEWKCDEYDEELLDSLREQAKKDSVVVRRHIEKLKDKMDALVCSRFEDFG